jgi:hypothetical protein
MIGLTALAILVFYILSVRKLAGFIARRAGFEHSAVKVGVVFFSCSFCPLSMKSLGAFSSNTSAGRCRAITCMTQLSMLRLLNMVMHVCMSNLQRSFQSRKQLGKLSMLLTAPSFCHMKPFQRQVGG